MAKGINWIKLKSEYILGGYKSLNVFAKDKGLNVNGNFKKQTKGWSDEKVLKENQKSTKIIEKTIEKVSDKESSRQAKILSISDKLASKIEQAVEQLESYLITNKVKTKTVEYNGKENGFKPAKEVTVENEVKEIVSGIIDKQGLKFLTTALRDIKELQPKEDNNADAVNKNNDNMVLLANLLNAPVEDRKVQDFEDDE